MSLERLSVGDNTPTVFSKLNKVIDDAIIKAGATVFISDFKPVADGVTDDTAIIQAAFDSAVNGMTIVFPNASIAIAGTVSTNKKLNIIGNYCNIILNSNQPAFYLQKKDGCVFKQFNFFGSGRNVVAKTDQVGVYVTGGTKHLIQDIYCESVSGTGILMANNVGESTTLLQQGCRIENVMLFNNYTGIAMMSRSEYNVLKQIHGYENYTVIQDCSGNNNLDGFSFQGSTGYAYRMVVGNNVGHGSIGHGSINHHTSAFGIHCNANGTGVLIDTVNFYQTHNKFENGTKAVVFQNCAFDGSAASGAITFDGATTVQNYVLDCLFTVAGVDPTTKIVATSSAKFTVKNLVGPDGKVWNFGNASTTITDSKVANFTFDNSMLTRTIKIDCTAGAVTAALPAPTLCVGLRASVMKIDASANAMNLDPGANNINGSTTDLTTTTQWDKFEVESDGTQWLRRI